MGSNTGKTLKAINDLGDLLSQLLAVDLGDLTASGQVQCLQALRPVACQVEAVQLKLIGVIDQHDATAARGSASTAAWLRNVLRVPNAAGMVRSAAALSTLPRVAAAFAAGEIGNAHVVTIAKAVQALPADALTGVEEVLVEQARQLPPSRFAPVATRIRNQVVPPPAKPRQSTRREPARWLRTDRGPEGRVSVTGMFDAANGQILLESLTAATESPAAGDVRELAVRRADALLELCRRATGGQGDPIGSPRRPPAGATLSRPEGTSRSGSIQSKDSSRRGTSSLHSSTIADAGRTRMNQSWTHSDGTDATGADTPGSVRPDPSAERVSKRVPYKPSQAGRHRGRRKRGRGPLTGR